MAVYLDHAATTPMLDTAARAYLAAAADPGNPSSIHSAGQRARMRLEEARERIAATLGCEPVELLFTSGGTEAVNLAIKGLFWKRAATGATRILVPGGEHHATIDAVEWLEAHEGARIQWLPLDGDGRLRLDALEAALADDPSSIALVTALWANNEVGTVQDVERIATLAAAAGVPLHLDAVAAYGHLPIDVAAVRTASASGSAGLVAVSVSAHKIGGPIGAGGLVLSRQSEIVPLIHGGGQQRARSGTQDVAAAVAFAVAAETTAGDGRQAEADRVTALRDALEAGVLAAIPAARVNGFRERRLPGTSHLTLPGAQGDSLLFLLDAAGIAVSTGSACQAGIPEPSHVLLAMGRSADEARCVVRVSLGATSTAADVDGLVAALPAAYEAALRAGLS